MTVAVIFGGKSCEHNISIITAVQTMQAISVRHEVVPVYIDNSGTFYTGEEMKSIKSFREGAKIKKRKVHFVPNDRTLYYSENNKPCKRIDVALLCNHGLNGEDGTLQGYLQLCGIPFTGSKVLGSACAMDKSVMKGVFLQSGLPVLPYITVLYSEYKEKTLSVVERIKESLEFPLIVKPANLGSSIGISIAHNFEELFCSIDTAFSWDNKIVIENALSDFIELNCAVLNHGGNLLVSQIEQPVGWKEFLTFDDKYTKKSDGLGRLFPAPVSDELKEKIQAYAKKAFSALECSGVARIDFLYTDELYINEINTIPGALSNYLFDFSFTELIEKLIETAVCDHKKSERLKYVFKPSFNISSSKGGVKRQKV